MSIKLVFVFSILSQSVFAIDYPKDVCGLRPLINTNDPPNRVVGGVQSKPGDWPWKISMLLNGRHVCGGSLINDEWIITAAHCVAGNTNRNAYRILFGVHDRLGQEAWVISRNVQRIVIHPQYSSSRFLNDIALMQLSTKVEPYTEYYMPVCFPSIDQTFANQTGYTVGWGAQSYGGTITRYLMEVATRIVDDNECRKRYSTNMINTNTQICSGGNKTGACQGDSGGPFIVADPTRGGRYTLAGLISWGIGCGDGGVYTRVSAYRQWVESIIGSALP